MNEFEKDVRNAYIGLALIALIIGVVTKTLFFPTPDFSVGECIREVYKAGEFTPRELSMRMYRIEKIGRENYLLTSFDVYDSGHVDSTYSSFIEFSIMSTDLRSVKANCETGEEL